VVQKWVVRKDVGTKNPVFLFLHKRSYTFGFEMPLTDDARGRRQGAEEL